MKDRVKHENITLSIPSDINLLLHSKVPRRGISKYVTDAIRKSLLEDEKNEELKLEAFYEAANSDSNRVETVDDFKALDEIDDIEGWEWSDE